MKSSYLIAGARRVASLSAVAALTIASLYDADLPVGKDFPQNKRNETPIIQTITASVQLK